MAAIKVLVVLSQTFKKPIAQALHMIGMAMAKEIRKGVQVRSIETIHGDAWYLLDKPKER